MSEQATGERQTEVMALAALSDTFQALSDPTRREILRLLSARDRSAGEIAEHFAMTKPSISHHLNVLKQAGLVVDQRRGQHIIYSIDTTVFQDVIAWVWALTQRKGNESGESGESPRGGHGNA